MLEDKQKLLLEIEYLRQEVEKLKQEKLTLEVLFQSKEASFKNQSDWEQQEKLAQFLEMMSLGVWVTDRQGNLCYSNEKAQQILGQHIPFSGKDCSSEIFEVYLAGTEKLYPLERHPLKRALKGEEATVDDIELHRMDKIIPLELWANPVFDEEGKVIYVIVVFQDITQRKQTERIRISQKRETQEFALKIEEKLQQEIQKRQQLEIILRKMTQELENLATLDDLTQVANRRYMEEYLLREWRRLTREKVPLSFIVCDIDCFTGYNDTYGRQAGDECLQQIARAIRHAVRRPSDLIARYDSTKFAILLPNTDADGATQVASAIRWEVKMLKLVHTHSSVSHYVTVSAGVSSIIPMQTLFPQILTHTAEDALYEAKKQGKNRVVFKNV